jgi:LmbE family N-acetylglucosaminyl deacetylase
MVYERILYGSWREVKDEGVPVKVLVIVAHPDDEVFGCGGTIARYTKQGDDVFVCVLAEGCSARFFESHNSEYTNKDFKYYNDATMKKQIDARKKACIDASKILGVKEVFMHDLTNQRLDELPILKINKIVERHVAEIEPDVVFIHTDKDTNKDHRIVHEASMVACRKTRNVFSFECIYSTTNDFRPTLFFDIDKVYSLKQKALECYHGEIKIHSHVRTYNGVRSLAVSRGICANLLKAEAFEVNRMVI